MHDSGAVAVLYERYRDKLRLALRRKLGPSYRRALLDSEDAVQDGILAAMASLDRFEYQGEGSFLAWVLRVSEREILQRLRAQRAQMRDSGREVALENLSEPRMAAPTPSEVAQGHEAEERVQACLECLPEQFREVIVLRRYLDLSTEEIRVEMKLPTIGAVRAMLSRAQTRLAVLLDCDPVDRDRGEGNV